MNRNPIGAASSPDLTKLEDEQPTCRSKHCLGCGHMLDSRKPDWIGLPAGVKFDPTDQELIEHLEAKVNSEHLRSHPLIDEFIRTIKGEDGICYTHPEKLPGVTRNGLSKHFFHRPSKAYTTGTRKRRKIQTECDLQGGETRWHKTGKTRPVMVNGNQKGCKKILVLYTNFGKHRKPEKTNWVMHQYHLGDHEEEKDGELVVSKIFYQTQPRQCNWSDKATSSDAAAVAAAAANVVATTTTVSVEQQCCFDHRRPESTGSGSCSSSKDVVGNNSNSNSNNMRDDLSSVAAGISAFAATSTTPSMEHMHHHQQHIKAADNFSFSPFRKTFDEVGLGEKTSEQELDQEEHDHRRAMVQQQQQQQQQQRQVSATSAFHVSRPSNPIAAILAPAAALHHSSIILDDPYQRFLHLQNDRLQQQQEQVHQHHKLMGRPTSGLEELIMGCAPSGLRGEPQIEDSHGTEWLKYSYWPDPDNQDDHHHG